MIQWERDNKVRKYRSGLALPTTALENTENTASTFRHWKIFKFTYFSFENALKFDHGSLFENVGAVCSSSSKCDSNFVLLKQKNEANMDT